VAVFAATALLSLLAVSVGMQGTLFLARGGNGDANAKSAVERVPITPRQLLESDDFAEVMTDNAFKISQGKATHVERAPLQERIRRELKQISADIWQEKPETNRLLSTVQMQPKEQDGFLTMMRSISDPRVTDLGHTISLYLRDSMQPSRSHDESSSHFWSALEPRIAEIRRLREEVIPEVIRGNEDDSDNSFNIDNDGIHFLRKVKKWHVELDVTSPTQVQERRLASSNPESLTGSAEMDNMVKVLRMKQSAEIYVEQAQDWAAKNFNLHIPSLEEATRGVDTSALLSCGMEAMMSMDLQTCMECAMQFWSIAVDVMNNVKGSIGAVTTTTEQTVFESFDDLMS